MRPVTAGIAGTAPRLAALLLAAGAGACRAQPAVAPAPCAPVPAGAATAAAGVLAGGYRLTLVATQGPRAGKSVTGELRLQAYDRPAQIGTRYPVRGTAAIALDSVGAQAPGDIGSASAARPGVLGMEWRRSGGAMPDPRPQLTLRFGADANGPETGRIEGVYMALQVDSITTGGFAGRWNSGVENHRAGGHFCANRIASRG
ncbi:MAG TPA: hypothetical protein VFS20_16170 [Longimicrobium sp.]|nr:hypothetical protein [Longimicrobium sp.]